MTQRDIILAAFQRGDRIKGSDSLRLYNIAEPSFKRLVHSMRKDNIPIDDIEIPPANGGHEYKEYFLAKEKDGTSGAEKKALARQLDCVCPACGKSVWIYGDNKCTACGVVRKVPRGWFGN